MLPNALAAVARTCEFSSRKRSARAGTEVLASLPMLPNASAALNRTVHSLAPPTADDTLSAIVRPAIRPDLQHLPPVEDVAVSFVDGRVVSLGTNHNEPQSGLIPTQWNADVIRLIPTPWDAQVVLAGQGNGRASATPIQAVPATCRSR